MDSLLLVQSKRRTFHKSMSIADSSVILPVVFSSETGATRISVTTDSRSVTAILVTSTQRNYYYLDRRQENKLPDGKSLNKINQKLPREHGLHAGPVGQSTTRQTQEVPPRLSPTQRKE